MWHKRRRPPPPLIKVPRQSACIHNPFDPLRIKMTKKPWDDIDREGKKHYRLARSAERHLKIIEKQMDSAGTDKEREALQKSYEAWSLTLSRHTRAILKLMRLKYEVARDLYGIQGWEIIHNPKEVEVERTRRKKQRESDRASLTSILQGY
jgi:hypothetical protein